MWAPLLETLPLLAAGALWQLQRGVRRRGRAKKAAIATATAATAVEPSPPLFGASAIDLRTLDTTQPERFYLPDDSFEKLSDCFAIVEGTRLPLHIQLLASQAGVLRQLFVGQTDNDGVAGSSTGSQTTCELSSAFSGCTLTQALCFLRLIYSPDHATAGSLHAIRRHQTGLLAAVAGLAHRLDASSLLAKIEGYLQRFSAVANITQLLSMVQLAESCHLAGLADTCLSLLARQLAAAGPFWSEQVQHAQLAACSSDSLARLACKMAGCVHAGAFQPPKVHGVRRGLRGAAGGFTWMLPFFSRQRGRVTSPWVEVGGVEWRLKVWPQGDDAAGGTHLSAYLECNYAHAASTGLASVDAHYEFCFIDQSQEGLHYTVDCGKDLFTSTTQNWGKTRMMTLEELTRSDRSYLAGDQLAIRINIRVVPPASLEAAAAATAAVVPVPHAAMLPGAA